MAERDRRTGRRAEIALIVARSAAVESLVADFRSRLLLLNTHHFPLGASGRIGNVAGGSPPAMPAEEFGYNVLPSFGSATELCVPLPEN